MTVLHTGSTQQFADNWDRIFSRGKKSSAATATKSSGKKSGKKVAVKAAAKRAAKQGGKKSAKGKR